MTKRLFHLSLLLPLILAIGLSCGDPAEETDQQEVLLSASALDGVPFAPAGVDQTTGLVFPLHMRAFALQLESDCIRDGLPVDDPELAASVEALFRKVLTESEGIRDEGFVASCLSTEIVTLDSLSAPRKVLKFLSVGGMARVLKPCILHPASPAGDWSQIPVRSAPEASGKPHAVYVTVAPSYEAMVRGAIGGACLWLVGPETDEQEYSDKPTIRAVSGRRGRPLPAALLYMNPTNRRALKDVSMFAGSNLSCRIAPLPAVPAKVVIGRIKGVGSRGRLIVRVGNEAECYGTEAGSRGLQLSVLLDVARVLAINLSRRESWRPNCDIEFVHVMDRGAGGYEFGASEARASGVPVLGVIEVGSVAAQDAQSESIVLTFDPGDVPSACERALVVAATGFLGKPGAWRGAYLRTARVSRIAETTARSLGQERVPTVTLAGCLRHDSESHEIPALWRSESIPGSDPLEGAAPSIHVLSGTSVDRVSQVSLKSLKQSVNVGRLLLLTILRTAHAKPMDD
jgi:hypothetical protein